MKLRDGFRAELADMSAIVDDYITDARLLKYVKALTEAPGPSTTVSFTRAPVIRELLNEEKDFIGETLHFYEDYKHTGNSVLLTGGESPSKDVWYFAHIDTISYLPLPREGDRYPLTPFCYHLIKDNSYKAEVLRFDLEQFCYVTIDQGSIVSEDGNPFYVPGDLSKPLRPGDRVIFDSHYRYEQDTGDVWGLLDNSGAAAAMLAAAPIVAKLGIQGMFAFTDEEEGPEGSGNQTMGRGGRRLLDHFATPKLAISSDVQQALEQDGHFAEGNVYIGKGPVLSECASLGRGALTPPHLYELARSFSGYLPKVGISVQESFGTYISRSDDINAFQKTPNVLLLGFPGNNRHFDDGVPKSNLRDIVQLAKSLVYFSVLPKYMSLFMEGERW